MLLAIPSTLYAVRVSQNQLDQSKEATEQGERAQASRVSSWIGEDAKGLSVHLMNRTPDPIADVRLEFATVGWPDKKGVKWEVSVAGIPPCTDMVIDQDQLGYVPHEIHSQFDPQPSRPPAGMRKLDGGLGAWLQTGIVTFVDRDGKSWTRHSGRLTPGSAPYTASLNEVGAGIVVGPPTFHSAGECSDSK
ncbi:hypothetical protein ACWERY_30725 [Streptomyces sp. NPDC004082]